MLPLYFSKLIFNIYARVFCVTYFSMLYLILLILSTFILLLFLIKKGRKQIKNLCNQAFTVN